MHYETAVPVASGGTATVLKAWDPRLERWVALKYLKYDDPLQVERLLREAQAQSRLHHPNICEIYDVAEDERGRPYICMQYIDGPPLDEALAGTDLPTRVRLVQQVAKAIHSAHTAGIVHRDLKPGNILVETQDDGSIKPYVVDFGLARLHEAPGLTVTGEVMGTPAYMSPEQAGGRAVDALSDVYSLGAVLYHVLGGRPPFDGDANVSVLVRVLEDEPKRLRRVEPSVPPELETVTHRCLEKDKEQRYPSAAELAADLGRVLNGEPIVARPPSAIMQLKKFARRNRPLAIGFSTAMSALIVGLAVSIAGWNAATRARVRAETEAAKATQLNSFLTEILQAPDPWVDGREVKVVDLLARAAETIDESFSEQPEVAALAHHRLGYTLKSLGEYDDAKSHIERALAIAGSAGDLPSSIEIDILVDLGATLVALGELHEADTVLNEAFDRAASELEVSDPARTKSVHELAILRWEQGELEHAETLFRQCLELSTTVYGPQDEETIITAGALGNVLRQLDRLDEAEPLLERALEWNLEHNGPDHPGTAIVVNNLAFVYQKLEQHEQALDLFRDSLATRLRLHDHDSMSIIVGLNNLGLQLTMMGRHDEALAPLEEAVDIAGRIFPADDWRVSAVRGTYGRGLMAAGRHAEAEHELLASFEGQRSALGDDHWRTQTACKNLADLYQATGDGEREARYRALLPEATAQNAS
ncbi:MAG: serine/threonine-protein kinase [Thermoanaerobaculales bacterium]|jgi:tetratricopeptide (TPR) repeat protein/predicted Ser/Thr protein kinase|nr:serine/threonine-protein kinase [Thermoanaerobaculales bacterium]